MTDEQPDDDLPTNERVAIALVAIIAILLAAQLAGVEPARIPDPAVFASILTVIATLLVGRK